VKLLLAWIETPEAEPMELTQRLSQQHVAVTVDAVDLFLKQHQLHSKKS
jgi:hypothetical protein